MTSLDIELTERCNNNCLHCCINRPTDDQSAVDKELPIEFWYDVLRQAVDLGAITVRFTGREPLLHPHFIDIYLFA